MREQFGLEGSSNTSEFILQTDFATLKLSVENEYQVSV